MDRTSSVLLSVVIPCFNEASVVGQLHHRLITTLEAVPRLNFELLYVNDGSTDATLQVLHELQGADERVKTISFSRNFGHEIATTAGMRHAAGDIIALIDADLQDPPEVLPEMIDRWHKGADVAYGVRTRRDGETKLKCWTARGFYLTFNRLSNITIPIDAGDFRVMDRQVVDAFLAMPERNRFVAAMVPWTGFDQEPIPYQRAPRAAGKTKYSYTKLWRLAINTILSFSSVPLHLATWFGFFACSLGLTSITYNIIVSLFINKPISVWTTLLIAILILSGMQLMFLGIFSEYLRGIYNETQRRPLYLIKESLGFAPDDRLGHGNEPMNTQNP